MGGEGGGAIFDTKFRKQRCVPGLGGKRGKKKLLSQRKSKKDYKFKLTRIEGKMGRNSQSGIWHETLAVERNLFF